ncbi:glycerophosphoryl diester phosphodiesterase [Microbacterium ginsengiterrae]|uniref:Glycerophosphoryl diester phosphodiesterase n=1 Tax=Microbacterium ginsengiterrae TaxID=546115 RepID=A0A7W9CDC1_9MICO|nr:MULTISPECIES: glycerophosphodiester phosphodiesterase family protein [Microbacterium]MBB5743494.1 glycerophosphoryl diester phosphodiesterase [Microbacterium ginsengiterrae]
MGCRRRRLWGAGSLVVSAWLAVLGIAPSAAGAILAVPPVTAVPARTDTHPVSSLAAMEGVILRPLTVLRTPGETGAVVAHRGHSSVAPENTMPAVLSSISSGAEYVEIDIRMSADGVPVVIHDETVDRTTDGSGVVAEMTLAQLRGLDAGAWWSDDFAGARIPTLREVLDVVAGSDIDLIVEYKGTWTRAEVRTTVDLLTAYGLRRSVIAQSFSEKTAANIVRTAPGLRVGLLTHVMDPATIAEAVSIGAHAVNARRVTARGVALAHRAGLGVLAWTPDTEDDWEMLTRMGVDGIITNRPDALREWVRTKEKAPGWSPGPSDQA